MKNRFITSIAAALIFCLAIVSAKAQSETATIGTGKNGVGVVTDLVTATKVLKANLSPRAIVSNVKVEYSPDEQKYYLTGVVKNDPASSIAIQLHENGDVIYAMSGPGVEVTCNGFNCSDCRVSLNGGIHCECFKSDGTPVRCDMTSKVYVGL